MRRLLLFACICLSVLQTLAQNRTISGKVTDDKGVPLAGVTIAALSADKKVVGTSLTQSDGTFTLGVTERVRQLQVSFVGYDQFVAAAGSTPLEIKLVSNMSSLSEVVVVGYGVQQKKAFTGSAAKIEPEKFSNLLTPSVDKQLAGRATSVQVTNSSGLVSAAARIRIRRIQSISYGNDPLIVQGESDKTSFYCYIFFGNVSCSG